jgi:glycosyltransferase involved in cell wall biosynthesis
MRALCTRLGLDEQVEFAGWQDDRAICTVLSTADVCLAPDPPSPLNDVSTMMKIPEYMAFGCPVASYALPESKASAGESALYADSGEPRDLARCIADLLEDPERRARMGAIGRRRVETELSWGHSRVALLNSYARAMEIGSEQPRSSALASH